MLYEAAFWRRDRPRPPIDVALSDPALARYVDEWGRPGDAGVIAAEQGVPIGAAWYRLFPPDAPGYGFLGVDIPELSIGVRPEWRGRGIGTALLGALIERARREGVRALSLSVEPDNPARRLYERHGFVRRGTTGGSWTMARELDATYGQGG